ncbi:MAG: hypothetical protein A2096_13560 [Spirochaetes bacterium GWF1_41_5]|nr:MAG: hypothetical protein A2096_13560 [Spirochaetes bacterium GWF1_41_5]HBE03481.1 hypothetical protein [Spirochaetia bacterium]
MKSIITFLLFGSLLYPQIPVLLPGTDKSVGENPDIEFSLTNGKNNIIVHARFVMNSKMHVYSSEKKFFKIEILENSGTSEPVIKLPSVKTLKEADGSITEFFSAGQVMVFDFPLISADWKITGKIRFQACDDSACFAPMEKQFQYSSEAGKIMINSAKPDKPELFTAYKIAGRASGYKNTAAFSAFIDNYREKNEDNMFSGKSVFLIILLVLAGGFALNLTPCVLPLIPITLSIIGAGNRASSRRQGFLTGGVYGAGMAISYGLLGALAAASGGTFGAINSSWVFTAFISLIFIVLGLSMFDIIQIDLTRFRSGKPGKTGSLFSVFFMGAISALLAGACVAPVIISVIVYAASEMANGNYSGLLLPFLLGIGMALPWPLAGAGLSFLPSPGDWMTKVKYVFGIFIFAFALYYARETWMLIKPAVPLPRSSENELIEWEYDLDSALIKARKENKPIFIDFWADWCKNCLAMDASTFRSPAVADKLSSFIRVKFIATDINAPEIKKTLEHFNVAGLPTYIILEIEK